MFLINSVTARSSHGEDGIVTRIGFRSVTCRISCVFRQRAVNLFDTLRNGDRFLSDDVQKPKQHLGSGAIVTEINLAWVNSVVADDANNVENLLDTRVKPIRNQRRDVEMWSRSISTMYSGCTSLPRGG